MSRIQEGEYSGELSERGNVGVRNGQSGDVPPIIQPPRLTAGPNAAVWFLHMNLAGRFRPNDRLVPAGWPGYALPAGHLLACYQISPSTYDSLLSSWTQSWFVVAEPTYPTRRPEPAHRVRHDQPRGSPRRIVFLYG